MARKRSASGASARETRRCPRIRLSGAVAMPRCSGKTPLMVRGLDRRGTKKTARRWNWGMPSRFRDSRALALENSRTCWREQTAVRSSHHRTPELRPMKRVMTFALVVLGLTGCGPDKKQVAQAQVNQLAESWDGSDIFMPEGTDPWGEPYTAKVEKGDIYRHLTVRSNGPDRLPLSHDDIVAKRSMKHASLSEAAGKAAERIGEGLGKGLGRGGVIGVKEGLTGKSASENRDAESKDGNKND